MAAKVRCPQCGKLVKRSLRYCDQCGSDLSALAETTPGARRSGSLPFVLGVVITLLVIAVGFIVLMLTGVIRTGDGDVPATETPQPTAQITDVPPAGPTPTVMSTPAPTPEPDRSAEFYNSGLAAGIEQATATYEPQLAAQYQAGLADGFAQAASTYEPQLAQQYQDGLNAGIQQAKTTYEPQLAQQYQDGLNAGIQQAKTTYEPQLTQQYHDGVNAGIQQAKNTYEPQITNYEQQLSEFEDLLFAVVEAYESPSDAIQDPTMVQTFPISATLSAEKSYIVSINSAAQIRYYSFTPVTTGYYTLYSSGAFNTRAALYRDDDLLAEDDDSGDRYNFKLTYYLRAERTYIFSVKMTSVAAEGSFSIRLIHGFN